MIKKLIFLFLNQILCCGFSLRWFFWAPKTNIKTDRKENIYNLSQCMRFPAMWYLRPAKPQISLLRRAVWSEPLLVTWVFYDCQATNWTPFGVSKLKRWLQRLVWVYTCQKVKLLELSCRGSIYIEKNVFLDLWNWKFLLMTYCVGL